MQKKANELNIKQLRRHCDPKMFKFTSTEDLPALGKMIGQDRAISALSFGLEINSRGYHIYALGPVGTGKSTFIRKMLDKEAQNKPIPDDWLYVNNFQDKDKPRAVNLPAGKGREFQEDMDQLVEELKTEVPKALESKEYQQKQESIETELQRKIKNLFQELEEKASKKGLALIQTPSGMTVLPVINNNVITPEQYAELDENKKDEIDKTQEEFQGYIRETFRQVEKLQKEGKESVRSLDQRVVGFAVDHLIKDLKQKYRDFSKITDYLSEAGDFLLKNIQKFKQISQKDQLLDSSQNIFASMSSPQEVTFDEYRVNLLVDNSSATGAAVILEKNPIGPNIVGRIEQQGMFGMLITNFGMIKAGSLHKANGGYLIIEALDILQKPFAWQMLKRALKNREIAIESIMESYGAFTTRTLEPEPIPLDIKVILIGDPYIYYLLYHWDQEFKELFKVQADFETRMDWNANNTKQLAQFIGAICREENLKHFDPTGVAKIVEFTSRQVDHQKKLSTRFGEIVDIIRQTNYWASKNHHQYVTSKDVIKTLEEKIYRSNLIEQQIQEMFEEGTILIDTDGKVVGQVNGLSVLMLGNYAFGKPSRITVQTYVGSKGIVNIDREVKLGRPIYNKGTMIISGYLGGKFAQNIPMAFSSSITFEQLYDEIDGDSASSTEIYALLSSLSGYPIRQDIAVTGSVNQMGEIQPIGGVNEKIEGFFHTCKIKGLTGKQGVMIPKRNINNLMLNDAVIEAVKKGKFHIYAVDTIDKGIEILTGIKAGKCKKDGTYSKNTVNHAVQQRIIDLATKAKAFTQPSEKNKAKKK